MKRRELVLLCALLIGGIVYVLVDDSPIPPSADEQRPVAIACLKRAGLDVEWDVPTGVARNFDWVLNVKDEDGPRVAIVYLADLDSDSDFLAERLKDDQKTYGDYEGETIEVRGTSVIRLVKGYGRAGPILECMDRSAKVTDT
jgi:hypothetical protein